MLLSQLPRVPSTIHLDPVKQASMLTGVLYYRPGELGTRETLCYLDEGRVFQNVSLETFPSSNIRAIIRWLVQLNDLKLKFQQAVAYTDAFTTACAKTQPCELNPSDDGKSPNEEDDEVPF